MAKNIARTARRQLDGRHLFPKLADKQAIEDELSIDGGKAFCFGTYTQPHSIIANYDFENFFLAFIGQLRDGECFSLQFSCAN